jgi:SAM-dependent methyltransferase
MFQLLRLLLLIGLAALAPEGKVFGPDYLAASVAVARGLNAHAIGARRVQIEQGSVAALPFPDCTFDIVTAVETHYCWPDLPNVREILRVLKPGGTFALIAETYRGGIQAGFSEVTTKHVLGKNWICATGRRPI